MQGVVVVNGEIEWGFDAGSTQLSAPAVYARPLAILLAYKAHWTIYEASSLHAIMFTSMYGGQFLGYSVLCCTHYTTNVLKYILTNSTRRPLACGY